MRVGGIDVSQKTVMMAMRKGEKTAKPRQFHNSTEGHLSLIKALRSAQVTRVCLEATGTYHLDLALALCDAGLQVMVLNPKAAKRFAEAKLARTKTDAVDAMLLAEFAVRMPFEPWQRPDARALSIRACARRISALNQARTAAKNRLHAARQTTSTPSFLIADLELSIQQFDTQIHSLRQHAIRFIDADEHLHATFDLLITIKGIATASAIQIMGELLVLPQDMRAKQWVAMAGLDPRAYESGTSVQKKPRLSKAGNRYLRMALFMPALSASLHDPNVRAFYRHLIDTRGLKAVQAICAVMRTLLLAIHAMVKAQTPFDSSRFYQPIETINP
jgi:transposase